MFSNSLRSLTIVAVLCVFSVVVPEVEAASQPVRKVESQGKRVSARATAPTKARLRATAKKRIQSRRAADSGEPLSLGKISGLHKTHDALGLKSSVALVVDEDANQVLLSKNDSAILPIASITKLMTGLIVSEAKLPLSEVITLTEEDVVSERGVRSRLKVGEQLSRGELLHLALMSSENRAAHALGRTYPGGLDVFVRKMNERAASLGMLNTRYVEPTGLSPENRSTAQDLATLVSEASKNQLVSHLSTSPGYELTLENNREIRFINSNRLTYSPGWDIVLQKTGYIAAAGRCLVMKANVAGRRLIMVFLDSVGRYTRFADAQRVKTWIEANKGDGAAPGKRH